MKRSVWAAVVAVGVPSAFLGTEPISARAPAPLPHGTVARWVGPADLAGQWVMTWGGVTAPVTLTREGRYNCRFQGQPWVGCWSLDVNGHLCIAEAFQRDPAAWPAPESFIYWTVEFVRDGKGCLDRNNLAGRARRGTEAIPFRLTRPHPAVRSAKK
jgi:hypothetical protein